MGESKLSTVLNILPTLGAEDLQQVHGRTTALLAFKPASSPGRATKDSGDADLILEVIHEVLRDHGLVIRPEQLRTTAAYATFAKKVPVVMSYLRQCVTNRAQHRAILRIGIDLIHRYLTKKSLPAGTRVLMAHIHRVPEVIEQQFPGYAAAGMLSWVAKREQHVR